MSNCEECANLLERLINTQTQIISDLLNERDELAAALRECDRIVVEGSGATVAKVNPGSDEAVKKGCTCPRIDNHYGKGIPSRDGDAQFWINGDCPLHAGGEAD